MAMDLLESVLFSIHNGQREFAPDSKSDEDLRRFQPIAQAFFHAQSIGLIGKVLGIKTAKSGEWLITSVHVAEGLTYLGAQRVKNFIKQVPVNGPVASALEDLGSDVRMKWERALDRKRDDPAGAITAARSLLETVCKHVLDEKRVVYDSGKIELHELYKLTASELRLSPSPQTDEVVKQILGGCSGVISGIGALRNKLGDAHGVGKNAVVADEGLAELAVNLAGSLALFIVCRSN